VPAQRQVGQIRNGWVKLNDAAKTDNGGIFLPWWGRIAYVELPAAIVCIMRNVCNPLALMHYPLVRNYRNIWHVLKGPLGHEAASLIVRF
jgi:hypothetical protein